MDETLLWYCLKTQPRQERVTSEMLRREAGLEVFSPRIRFKRARAKGAVWCNEAMFPGYIFARFVYFLQHRQVRATSGVSTVVSFGGKPAVVADEIITELREHVADEETVEIDQQIKEGSDVRVIQGPYVGVRTLVTRILPGRQRVAILLEILGMEREIEIDPAHLLPDVLHPMSKEQI